MIKEIKYFLFTFIIIIFIFLTGKYYVSDENKKKSYQSLSSINNKINLYSQNVPILKNDTQFIVKYVKNSQSKKKKFFFWELLDRND
jgi:hypothetical protein|tara:strand:+ start:1753 stop:2013 length:261 start_codon:yes stop_codon:yes gene_type:complete